MGLKDLLKNKLTKKELSLVPTSFDIIGNREKAVAIIEIPEKLQKKSRIIANALMKQHRNVKSVLEKSSPRKGIYRTRDYGFIKGDKNTEIMHVENGCRLLLDPQKVYFSPREGTERQRIVQQVSKKEIVMVFFAGAGPFAIVIAKKSKPKRVIGIELSEAAIDYFWKNVKLNKLENVDVVHGNVKQKARDYYGKCDRVIMPLPETAIDYLEDAAKCLKKKGVIHLYFFSEEEKIAEWKRKARKMLGKGKKHIVQARKVLPYGPRINKYRMDIEVG
ncbi:MAG: class I SAM-dependent methyltransferase family protein [Candidatus Aenigmarchaeota archaeon]|nr:class I SAM-dependent methyltransferase family protein [Candidatus Aenigmarchaeota archaeon]